MKKQFQVAVSLLVSCLFLELPGLAQPSPDNWQQGSYPTTDTEGNGQPGQRSWQSRFNREGGPGGGGPAGGQESEEAMKARRQEMLKRFDTNHDGVLDDNERAQMRAFMQQRRQQRMEMMRANGMEPGAGSAMGHGMGPGAGTGMNPGMGRGMGSGMGPGMGRNMGPDMGPGMGRGMGRGMGPDMGPGSDNPNN